MAQSSMAVWTDLADVLEEVGEGAGNDATVAVALSPSSDGKGLATACLAIGKHSAIIASQYTAQIHTQWK